MTRPSIAAASGSPIRWSQTQQRRDFDKILNAWESWKKEHDTSDFEISEAAGRLDEALEELDNLMKGRILPPE
jgi:hypothetical protein